MALGAAFLSSPWNYKYHLGHEAAVWVNSQVTFSLQLCWHFSLESGCSFPLNSLGSSSMFPKAIWAPPPHSCHIKHPNLFCDFPIMLKCQETQGLCPPWLSIVFPTSHSESDWHSPQSISICCMSELFDFMTWAFLFILLNLSFL